jgi:hypothetical protein
VFVTGWNEFIAGQWLPKHGWIGDPFSFVDQFDWKRSRDIEPNKGWGDKGDVYYMQLVDQVRKFKGMESPQKASPSKSIKIGKPGQWNDVTPYYQHYRRNTFHRDHWGTYNQYYVNNTGRNDIVGAKVARDTDNLYFYVETADALSPSSDRNWMMLFIDTDRNKQTGWNGYDFIINRLNPSGNQAVIEKNIQGCGDWELCGQAHISIRENQLEIEVARHLVDLVDKEIDIEFKWNDNMQELGNVMDFYVNGDTAPGGRFNFVYKGN